MSSNSAILNEAPLAAIQNRCDYVFLWFWASKI